MLKLSDLLNAGLLQIGDELIWERRVQKVTHVAVLNSNCTIETSDKRIHRTPSGAAKHLNGNKPVDGWLAWKLKKSDVSLSDLRKKLKN